MAFHNTENMSIKNIGLFYFCLQFFVILKTAITQSKVTGDSQNSFQDDYSAILCFLLYTSNFGMGMLKVC